MAYLAVINRKTDALTFYVTELNMTTTYKSIYITCNGRTSPNLAETYISQTSKWWEVTGLQCGTRYSVSWNITSAGGSTAGDTEYAYTIDCPVDYSVGSIPWVSINPSTTETGTLYVSWGDALNATHYGVEVQSGSSIVASNSNVYGNSITFTGIAPGSYTVKIYGKRAGESNGTPRYTDIYMPNLNPKPGQPGAISLSPSSETAGRLYVSWGSATDATSYSVTVYRSTGSYADSATTPYTSVTFTGLTEGATYYVVVTPSNQHGTGTSRTSSNVTMPVIKVRPNNWYWGRSMSSGQNVNITASDWNSFCSRINEFRVYKGGLGTTSFSTAYSGYPITAAQVNQARTAIQQMVPYTTTPSPVSTGGTVYPSFFYGLSDSLNSVN